MPPLPPELIATPFVTGTVGYVTNWLAIKMLFRPYRRRWYSLGWVGVIPRNRAKLAREVAQLVGQKLVGENDIRNAISSERFQSTLESGIERELSGFLSRDFGSLGDIVSNLGFDIRTATSLFIRSRLADDAFMETLNTILSEVLASIINNATKTTLGELKRYEPDLRRAVTTLITTGRVQDAIIDEVSNRLIRIVFTGKSLADVLPEEMTTQAGALAGTLAARGLDMLDTALNDPATRKLITRKLITFKDEYFSGGGFFDNLKLGFVNMMMTDDKIEEIVEKELPRLVRGIREDEGVWNRMQAGIREQIAKFLHTPLMRFAEKLGMERIYEFRSLIITRLRGALTSEAMADTATKFIMLKLDEEPNLTVAEALRRMGITIVDDPPKVNLGRLVDTPLLAKTLAGGAEELFTGIRISSIFDRVPKKVFRSFKVTLLAEINKLLGNNITAIVSSIDIENIVEEKIMSLDLFEVEDLLFSFMRDQFRWINILGFVLGFFFGLVQSLTILFL